MFCPQINNQKVRDSFNDIVEALGGEPLTIEEFKDGELRKQRTGVNYAAMNAAYSIWDMNNGNSIDRAPNGEPSILFQTLMEKYDGDTMQAIQAKSKVYSNGFKKWFGDWINNPEESSKVVDENGEPLIVYHYSNDEIKEFSTEFDNYFTKVKGGTKKAIFFTSNPEPKEGTVLDRKYQYAVFLNARKAIEKTGTKDELRNSGEGFTPTINRAAEEVDIAIFRGIDDNQEENQDIYVISDPTNVKSVDNSGRFISNSPNLFDGVFSPEALKFNEVNINKAQEALNNFRANRYDFSNVTTNLRQRIRDGVKQRIKAISNRNIPNKSAIITSLEYQLNNLENKTVSDLENIVFFIKDVWSNMESPIGLILRAQKNITEGKDSGLSNNQLIQFQQDYYGMYNTLSNEIAAELFNSDRYRDLLGAQEFDDLKAQVKQIQEMFGYAQTALNDVITDHAAKTLLMRGIDAGSNTIRNYVNTQLTSTANDMSMVVRLIGAGDKMSDEALRVMFNIVQRAEDKIAENTYVKGRKLLKLLDKVGTKQLKLFETDSKGKKTGYLVREKKYGQFRAEFKDFMKALKARYNVSEDRQVPDDINVRRQFNAEKNAWLEDHCERRFTAEYYNLFNSLSDETIAARDAIQFKIYTLLDKVRDKNGNVNLEKLSDAEWDQLQGYYVQKKQLASIYYPSGAKKQDIELQIALELQDLNKQLSGALEYKVNQKKFDEVKAEKKRTLSEEEFKKWEQRNTRVEIDPKFWEQLKKIQRREYGEEYARIQEVKREILNTYRDERTGTPNTHLMSREVVKTLKALDRDLRRIRKKTKKSGKKGELQFKDIAKTVTTWQYKRDKKDAMAKEATNPGYYASWEAQHHTYTAEGKAIPNSYYTTIVPLNEEYIHIVPSRAFSELSEDSQFYNKNYNENSDEYYQPKSSLYGNEKQFAELMKDKDLKALYSAILETIHESNEKLPFLTKNDPYKLPQISGSMYQFMKSQDNLIKGMLKYTADSFVANSDDVGFAPEKITTRPDGSPLRMVPTYYIKDLEDVTTMTNDLVGAVISYYKMAENFKQKTAIAPDLEIIKNQLGLRNFTGTNTTMDRAKKWLLQKQDPKKGTETRVYEFAKNFIDMQVYGELTKGNFFTIKGKQYNLSKLLSKLKNWGTTINLGLNFISASVGFITALHTSFMMAVQGRYFNMGNYMHAWKNTITNLHKSAWNIGANNINNKYINLMEYFEIGTEQDRLFKESNLNRAVKVAKRDWAFGIYSMSDFIIKGTILNSVMLNFRYFNGEFLTMEQFTQNYKNNEAEGKAVWSTLPTSYDVVSVENGIIKVDPKYAKAFEAKKFVIKNTAATMSATADGMLTPLQRTQMQANAWGALCMMHRQYLPNMIQERLTMKKHYDYNTGTTREALYRTPLRVAKMLIKDWGQKKQILESLDASDRANLRQIMTELPLLFVVYPLISMALSAEADDDKDNWLKQLCALLVVRSKFEAGAPYNVLDIINTVKSPSAIFSMTDNISTVINYPIYLFNNGDKVSKYGPYKGWTKLEKSLLKLTPFKNVWELQDPAIKRRYFQTQIDK